MKILPSKNISIISDLTKEEIIFILNKNTQGNSGTKFGFTTKKNQKEFEGTVKNNIFEIRKVIYSRNSFSPVIKGEISNKMKQTIINLNLELRSYTLILILIFLGTIGLSFLAMLGGIFTQGFNPLYCLPLLIIFLLIYANMHYEFNRETKTILIDLNNRFKRIN